MFRSIWAGVLLLAVFGCLAAAQPKAPAKELVDYVLDARRAGLSDSDIQQKAVKAGWPAAEISEALSYLSAAAAEKPGAKTTSAEPTPASNTKNNAAPSWQPANNPTSPAAIALPGGTQAAPSVPAGTGDAHSSGPNVNRGVPDDYQIGAGDVLQINVWKELDVPNVVVRPDGRITMPLIKDVLVTGLTPPQAERLITDQLSKFIDTPDVTVIVAGMHSKKVYFIGNLHSTAPIPYTYRMTVMQAISEAGGLGDYAKRKKIYVLRLENGTQYKLRFDYDAVLRGEHMEMNVPLLPGDTVVVP
jgi:polysaccharide export outer membrane protein